MFEALMGNPYAWVVLSLCTIISVPLGIYSTIKAMRHKEISFLLISNSIVRSRKKLDPQIKFTFDDNEIHNLTASKIALWNSGNEVINENDIVEDKELTIEVSQEAQMLSAEIIGVSDETNKFTVDKIDSQRAKVLFKYSEKNEGAVLQLLHTGSPDDIKIYCKIKGGKPIKDANPRIKEPRLFKKLNFEKYIVTVYGIASVILTLMDIIMIVSLFVPSVYDFVHTPMPTTYQGHILVVVIMTATVAFADSFCIKMIKQAFRLPIPNKLREYMK